MYRFKKIVLPVDFSDESSRAIPPAFTLARLVGGKVYMLHIIDILPRPNPLYAHYAPDEIHLREKIEKMRQEAVKKMKSFIPQDRETEVVDVEIVVKEHHSPGEGIIEEADRIGADIIIMNHRGWNPIANLLLGSTAEYILKNARCPVLVMKE